MNNVEEKKLPKRCVCLRPKAKIIRIDFILDLEIFTLSLVTFLVVIRWLLKLWYLPKLKWNKPKKPCFSQTRTKNHKDWLFPGLGNFYSKSWNFFDTYQVSLDTYLDDTIDSNEQCWSKISPNNRVSLKPEGKTIKIDFILNFEILTLSLVTFLIVII